MKKFYQVVSEWIDWADNECPIEKIESKVIFSSFEKAKQYANQEFQNLISVIDDNQIIKKDDLSLEYKNYNNDTASILVMINELKVV